MIYVNNVTWAQDIVLPLYARPSGTTYQLKIKRTTTTGGEYTQIPSVYASHNALHVTLSITLPAGLTDGEYEYCLLESGSIVSGGIISMSGSIYDDRQYNQSITYTEYDSGQQ